MKLTIYCDKDGLFTQDYIFTESGDIDENKFLRRELKRAGIEPPAIGTEITVEMVLVARGKPSGGSGELIDWIKGG